MTNNILRLSQVIAITGLSRASIYAKMNDGTFPQSRSLGARAVGWLEKDVMEWIENLPTSKESA
mgnify:CR=1 FL=1